MEVPKIEVHERNLRLVFKPSLAADLAKTTRTGSLRHFLELKAMKPALLEFQARLNNPAVGKEALRIVKAWLPEGTVESRTPPSAAFIVFDNDTRGGYGPLIFAPLYAFVQAYRKAALRKGGLPALSNESASFLAGLEREAIAQAPASRR